MLYIKDIFKACVCSFCENIYEYNSIDENEFIKYFKSFCLEENLQECLEICTSEIIYDTQNIDNVCDNLKVPKYINFEIIDIIEKCKNAFSKTIKVDKTINVGEYKIRCVKWSTNFAHLIVF